MENITNKTYLCNGYEVKAIEINNGEFFYSKEFKADIFLNLTDLCNAMNWNDNIKEFLQSKLKNGCDDMAFEKIDEYLKTYSEAEWIEFRKWMLNEIMCIKPLPTEELKEIRKQENKDMIKEIVKGVAVAIGLISALLIFNTL